MNYKLLLITLGFILLNNLVSNDGGMKLIEYFTDKFTTEKVPTEFNAYQLLKDKPLKKSVNYLAVPWTPLMNSKQLQKMKEVRLDGGFTICQHDDCDLLLPLLKEIGVEVVFSSNASTIEKHNDILVLPFPQFPINGCDPAPEKDIFYSFVGTVWTHPIRSKIMQLPLYPDVFVLGRRQWHFFDLANNQDKFKQEYKDVLARSRYSLCPRGNGRCSIRFWESLQAGAIPVMFGRELWLPFNIDWDACVVYIEEKDIPNLYAILKAIPEDKEMEMRANCLEAHRQCANENLVSIVRYYYDQE